RGGWCTERHGRWDSVGVCCKTDARRETGVCPLRVEEVDGRKWDVMRVVREHGGGTLTGDLDRSAIGRARAQLAECTQAPFANDPLGRLEACAKNALHTALVIEDGTVRKCEVLFFMRQMAVQGKQEIL